MHILEHGDEGPRVARLQQLLGGLELDGIFGDLTEAKIAEVQADAGILPDGKVGARTWPAVLDRASRAVISVALDAQPTERFELPRVEHYDLGSSPYRPSPGYASVTLRHDVALSVLLAAHTLIDYGVELYSSGGLRRLGAALSPSRSATSLHHLGVAIDLAVGAAMKNPHTDPYVVTRDQDRPGRYWRVYARTPDGERMNLLAEVNSLRRPEVEVTGTFVDVTSVLEAQGLYPIQSRRRFWDRHPRRRLGEAEWWHFQREGLPDFTEGETTYGECLLRVWPWKKLRGSRPWRHAFERYGVGWR